MGKPIYKSVVLTAYVIVALHGHIAQAGPVQDAARPKPAAKVSDEATLPMADGEVEDIDIANKYVILRHGPIANLNMEAMTMAFAVKDTAMLGALKVGDKVKFAAENVAEVATIMSLRIQK